MNSLSLRGTVAAIEFAPLNRRAAEARVQLNGLTRAQFDAMDTNQDGLLSRAELGDVVPPPTGCPAGKSTLPQLGDLFLLGLAMLALFGWSTANSNSLGRSDGDFRDC